MKNAFVGWRCTVKGNQRGLNVIVEYAKRQDALDYGFLRLLQHNGRKLDEEWEAKLKIHKKKVNFKLLKILEMISEKSFRKNFTEECQNQKLLNKNVLDCRVWQFFHRILTFYFSFQKVPSKFHFLSILREIFLFHFHIDYASCLACLRRFKSHVLSIQINLSNSAVDDRKREIV